MSNFKYTNDFCRVCLYLKPTNRSIFETRSNKTVTPEKMLTFVSGIYVAKHNYNIPEYPRCICKHCENLLENAFYMRNRIRRSQNILTAYFEHVLKKKELAKELEPKTFVNVEPKISIKPLVLLKPLPKLQVYKKTRKQSNKVTNDNEDHFETVSIEDSEENCDINEINRSSGNVPGHQQTKKDSDLIENAGDKYFEMEAQDESICNTNVDSNKFKRGNKNAIGIEINQQSLKTKAGCERTQKPVNVTVKRKLNLIAKYDREKKIKIEDEDTFYKPNTDNPRIPLENNDNMEIDLDSGVIFIKNEKYNQDGHKVCEETRTNESYSVEKSFDLIEIYDIKKEKDTQVEENESYYRANTDKRISVENNERMEIDLDSGVIFIKSEENYLEFMVMKQEPDSDCEKPQINNRDNVERNSDLMVKYDVKKNIDVDITRTSVESNNIEIDLESGVVFIKEKKDTQELYVVKEEPDFEESLGS